MKICSLLESQKIYRIIDASAKSALGEISAELKKLATKYSKHEADKSSVPAGPDSSKFRAQKSGMIQVENNVHTHSYYGGSKAHQVFLKIGGNVVLPIRRELKAEVLKIISKMVDDDAGLNIPVNLWCNDQMISAIEEDGTNWGGFGFSVRKYSESEEKQLDKYDLGD